MNLGFTMVDCKGLDLASNAEYQTIDGLYARCALTRKVNKPALLYNMLYNEEKTTPAIGLITKDPNSSGLMVLFGVYKLNVAPTNAVIITKLTDSE